MSSDADRTVIKGVKLTHPDRVLFPEQGITKRRLAEYFERVGTVMLPYVGDRPLTLVRCPAGHQVQCFFQKHAHESVPAAIRRVNLRERSGQEQTYMYVDSGKGLVAAAQIGVLELHIWGSRRDRLDRPDRLVFDLDPDEKLDFSRVRDAARELRDRLESAGLTSFPLLTGGKGIHVVVPLRRTREWDAVKAYARGLAGKMAQSRPDIYVDTASLGVRTGKIYIDWLRNERGATAIAPFSPRAKTGAPVATPVDWDELTACSSAREYTLGNIDKRLTRVEATWAGYFDLRQSITRRHLEAVGNE